MMKSFVRRAHFVGIGGVGMSGIARILLNLGYAVSGSDLKPTELTRRLAEAGARVFKGHRASNIAGAQVVVVSSAVGADNPEAAAARRSGVPVIQRAEMLAELARQKKTVTVSGTHGKTTTTAMTAMALSAAGADPTVVVGGQVANFGSNARLGMGDILVCEADESDGSFLKLPPLATIVTNIDNDHLDHYGSVAALRQAFIKHVQSIPFYGMAVLCGDDAGVRAILPKITRPFVTYGFSAKSDWRAKAVGPGTYSVARRGRRMGRLVLKVPGRHNALNALAALAVSCELGFNLKRVFKGLRDFKGVGRRLERVGAAAGMDFYDDYGHHPTELRATLSGLRELFPKRRVVVFFQPHRYSRTQALHRAFGPSLDQADEVFILPIYAAGEAKIRGVSSQLIVDSARRAGISARMFTRAVDAVCELREGDVVLSMGAGDVWKTGLDLMRRLAGTTLSST